MINRIILVGRCVARPELRTTKNNIAVCSFTLAVDGKFKDSETQFIDIVVWRGQAENCAKYLAKGKLAAVEGSLTLRTYEGKDGTKKKVAEVVAENVVFLSPKDSKPEEVEQEGYYAEEGVQSDLPF